MRRLLPKLDDDRGAFVSVVAGHGAIDVWNSMGPVLLTFLRTPLGLSNADIGLAVGAYQFLAGFSVWPTDSI